KSEALPVLVESEQSAEAADPAALRRQPVVKVLRAKGVAARRVEAQADLRMIVRRLHRLDLAHMDGLLFEYERLGSRRRPTAEVAAPVIVAFDGPARLDAIALGVGQSVGFVVGVMDRPDDVREGEATVPEDLLGERTLVLVPFAMQLEERTDRP